MTGLDRREVLVAGAARDVRGPRTGIETPAAFRAERGPPDVERA